MKKFLVASLFLASLLTVSSYGETVQIQNVASGKCLDVPNLNPNNHIKIQQYSCRGSNDSLINAQLWRLKIIKGKIQIQSVTSGKCLDVPDFNSNNHVQIQQYTCRGSNDPLVKAQLWEFKKIGNTTQIKSVTSGKCLDIPNLSTNNHVILQQFTCNLSRNNLLDAQLWRLDEFFK